MFGEGQKEHSLLISMDKAYLRPGTDFGVRDTKAGVIYDVFEPEKQKQVPQHDFNRAEVNQTPASFRFIRQHTETIEEKEELISDQHQSVVIIRPKYYIGSCNSVWGFELPMLFQEASKGSNDYSIELRKLVTFSHDVVFYFIDLTMKDVICATPQTGCLTKSLGYGQRTKKGPKNLKKHWKMSSLKNLSALKKTQPHCKEIAVGDNGGPFK